MNAKEFVIFFRRLLDRDMSAFITNMENLGLADKPPHEWTELLIKWLELSSEEDARISYGRFYK